MLNVILKALNICIFVGVQHYLEDAQEEDTQCEYLMLFGENYLKVAQRMLIWKFF